MKLVKNSKVLELPVKKAPSSNMAATFKRAVHTAQKEGWTKIVIIGQGEQSFGVVSSRMKNLTAVGLLEYGKIHIISDSEE